ncbi:GyrI-like domain-containing protein [Nocardia sp. NPDC052254]|uniref:GyrI-like domain-containing protein n=1 Tax=Nocardia sp. NPDC052254 TaxID=3155681 RepID=UPI003412894C
MTYRVDVCEVPPQALLRLPRAVRADRPGEDIAAGMQELTSTVTRSGLTASGPPTITYSESDRPGGATVVDFGVPIEPASDLSMRSGAEVVVCPANLVARACHRGGYEGLGAAYRSIAEFIRRNGYRVVGPPTEAYLIGPDEVNDPSLLVTEIRVPIGPVPVLVADLRTDFDTALRVTREALRHNGFTIIAEVDPSTALPGVRQLRTIRHTILEICRPSSLAQVLADDDDASAMIPTPVVVREHPGRVAVAAADPSIWAQALDHRGLILAAAEIRRHLVTALSEIDTVTTGR